MAFNLQLTAEYHARGDLRRGINGGYIANGREYPSMRAAEIALRRDSERRNGATFTSILNTYRKG